MEAVDKNSERQVQGTLDPLSESALLLARFHDPSPRRYARSSGIDGLDGTSEKNDDNDDDNDAAANTKVNASDLAAAAAAQRCIVAATVCIMLPYLASKICIASYTAYQEVLFGRIGGVSLEAESDAYHLLFLLLGTAMGGLRTTSILVAMDWYAAPMALIKRLQSQQAAPSEAGEEAVAATAAAVLLLPLDVSTVPRCGRLLIIGRALVFLIRGAPPPVHRALVAPAHAPPPHASHPLTLDESAMIPLVASCVTVSYASCAAAGMWFGDSLVPMIATNTNASIVAAVAAFGRGIWWGVWPTLLLYNKEQLLLATGRSALPFAYGGVVYCGLGAVLAAFWYQPSPDNTAPFAGVEGIARSLAASAWVAYAALKLHLWLDPWTRHSEIPLNTEVIVWRCLHSALTSSSSWRSTSRQLLEVLRSAAPHAVRYVGFAVPLGISNGLGLARQLIVAAVTSQCSSTAATAFSVSSAYFSTAEIVLLAASSTISAMVAADPKGCLRPAVITVLVFGILLGLPPLIAPAAVARMFGGSVYAFGPEVVDSVLHEVRYFNLLTFCSFYLTVIGMAVAAVLHGMRHVWSPMCLQLVANAVGVAWAIGFSTNGSTSCAWGVGGSVVANALTVIGLLILRRSYMRTESV